MMGDRTFTHFQSATAKTTYIIGEFPWQVRRDDQVRAKDYISPPFMLSGETTGQETTWSVGEYTSGRDIWQAFKLPGSPPSPQGVFANQPSPFGDKRKSVWSNAALFLSLALVILFRCFCHRQQQTDLFGELHLLAKAGTGSVVCDSRL